MTTHLHHLWGCAPRPLAHYLKGLGVLRILAQQKDTAVRGFWRGEHFCLLTSLDLAMLENFFLYEYAPTPFVSPWNRGSGFYSAEDPALRSIERSIAVRFANFRAGIAAGRKPLADISRADSEVRRLKNLTKKRKGMSAAEGERAAGLKNDPTFKAKLSAADREFKRLKADLLGPLQLAWRGDLRDWMDAAVVLASDGAPSWPALLGTGGSDAKLDFTNNAMRRLGDLFDLESLDGGPQPQAESLLRNALWGDPTNYTANAAVGQFLPGSAGGPNGTTGPDASARVNPWDLVLTLEGTVIFRSQATRRFDSRAEGRAAVPFAVRAHAVGHGTRGREKDDRGEQWMPLWERPSTFTDVRTLLGEGRAQLQRTIAQKPIDFARAVASLGVARGLTAFERYSYLERYGQTKFAVPIGRVATGVRVHARLIDDLAGWLDRLQRLVRDGSAPTRLAVAEGTLADAVFSVLTTHHEPRHWQAVLIAAARLEALQATGTGFEAGPLPRLSAGWLDAAGDSSAEWNLAVALGSAAAGYKRGRPFDTVRAHVLPLAKGRYATTAEKRLVNDPRVVMTGRDATGDLVALVERRLVEATQRGQRVLPLVAQYRRGAHLSHLAEFLEGAVDVERIVWLARALMGVQWDAETVPSSPPSRRSADVDEGWMALRLCGTPFSIGEHRRRVPIDLAMIRRLCAGDAASAVSIALRRLSAVGYRPPLVSATTDAATARRWVAALAFPVERAVAAVMATRFQNPDERLQSQQRKQNQMETP